MFGNSFTVFDVETPNRHNDRICSFGLVFVENGQIALTRYYLINPQCSFDSVNIGIHGITPEDVAGMPPFPDVWNKICHYFTDHIVVAHNAAFDLSVLHKTLTYYGIEFPDIWYLDTMKLVRSFYPDIPNRRLDTVCAYLDLHLEHHNAESDTIAAAEVLLDLLRRGLTNDPVCLCERQDSRYITATPVYHTTPSSRTIALRALETLLESIIANGEISIEEFTLLHNWMNDHFDLLGNYPFDDVFLILETTLQDGIIEEDELADMVDRIQCLLDPVCNACQMPVRNIKGACVVLTGEFARGSRDAVSAELVACGAVIQPRITSKTDILIVGSHGSEAWSAGKYGSKIKKALEMQAAGHQIQIIREEDFFEGGW